VRVHQGSALSPLLFIVVMQEATKEERGENLKELLYADDRVLMAEVEEEVVERFSAWKRGMEKRGLKVNMEKTKMMVLRRKSAVPLERGRYPCGCCGKGVGQNSVFCRECEGWCHQRCSGLQDVRRAADGFRCPKCVGGGRQEEDARKVLVGEDHVEIVDEFCYLWDVMRGEGGAECAVRARIASAWRKWRELARLLVTQGEQILRCFSHVVRRDEGHIVK